VTLKKSVAIARTTTSSCLPGTNKIQGFFVLFSFSSQCPLAVVSPCWRFRQKRHFNQLHSR
jgi:hypothetical protein